MLWTGRRGHTRDLDIPQHTRNELPTQIEDDHRWALVRSLLHDDRHAIEDRVAGLLVLLYGQPLARIARLTRDQITRSPCGPAAPRHRPPRPARTPGRARPQLLNRTHDQPWVFPGGAPGHPLSTAQLKVRLARLGIHGRSGRNTALMDLAAKLPPVALARLLGSTSTPQEPGPNEQAAHPLPTPHRSSAGDHSARSDAAGYQ